MPKRSVVVSGLSHGDTPIPVTSRVGSLCVSGGITGIDAATGVLPGSVEKQVELLFENCLSVVEAAGGRSADIAKMTFFVRNREDRTWINPVWVDVFPDSEDRPARHVLVHDLPEGVLVQCEVMAYIEENR